MSIHPYSRLPHRTLILHRWIIRGTPMQDRETRRRPRRPRPNDERDRRIVTMIQGGATLKQTATAFSLSVPRIQQIIAARGVKAVNGRELSPRRDQVVEMVAKGMSHGAIAEELGISRSRVSQLYRDEMARRGMEEGEGDPIP